VSGYHAQSCSAMRKLYGDVLCATSVVLAHNSVRARGHTFLLLCEIDTISDFVRASSISSLRRTHIERGRDRCVKSWLVLMVGRLRRTKRISRVRRTRVRLGMASTADERSRWPYVQFRYSSPRTSVLTPRQGLFVGTFLRLRTVDGRPTSTGPLMSSGSGRVSHRARS